MGLIQNVLRAVLPRRWGDSMEAESRQWKLRCGRCGNQRSVWDAGGVRWKAVSVGKRTLTWCPSCRAWRWASVIRERPDTSL